MSFTDGALTGAFLDLVVVEDLDGEEEQETPIGMTTGDIEMERDSEEAEFQIHNDGTMKRIELATALDLEFEMVLTDDRENLHNVGLIDEDGDGTVNRNVQHDSLRIVAYDSPQDGSGEGLEADTVVDCTEAAFMLEGFDWPIDDVATIPIIVWINGDIRFRDPEDVYDTGTETTE